MMNHYASCRLCPRNCGVNRLAGETGFCGETADLRIGASVIHKGEEPPLVGSGGSGTIFISGCNLGCSFCQNYQVSQGNNKTPSLGKIVSVDEEFVKICASLREKGAENINIVTGSHAIPSLVQGFTAARKEGIQLPVLWNSSAYETVQALELLNDYVDIYLPDLKTLDNEIASRFFNAPDYPQTAEAAILKMMEMSASPEKIIIRHLVLPGFLDSTRSVLRWFAENAAGRALLSLMTQYTLIPGRNRQMPNRFLSAKDYETVLCWLDEFDINDGFCQELVTGSDWLPDFNLANPFSSQLSVPVWHWKD
ncbi:MAG: radical SAM protein [Treponema sp.]|nr:radical SAM protein [Treponema sp.]MCL2272478.1 radical SAM protein [Treponema sp.]